MDQDALKMLAASFVRHLLTAVAGWMVSAGLLQTGDQSNFVQITTGIVLGALAIGWSWWQKTGHAAVKAQLESVQAKQQKGSGA